MILRSFRIRNFKCFRDTGVIQLKPGFNVLVGQNNSGKSTIIQALRQIGFKKPHRASTTKADEALDPYSILELALEVDAREFKSFCLRTNTNFNLKGNNLPKSDWRQDATGFLGHLLHNGTFNFHMKFTQDSGVEALTPPEHSLAGKLNSAETITCHVQPDRQSIKVVRVESKGTENVTNVGKSIFDSSAFHFDAQRVSLGKCGYGETPELLPDARNLARALLELNDRPALQRAINVHLSDIIPSIKSVVAVAIPNNEVEIKTSAYPIEEIRRDLFVPLSESGTGVGQVLAILFAAITFQEPKIILIDEPNSFLHPGAAKRLIEVLKIYGQHQYILTTHSAEIIAAAEPETIHQTRWEETESKVEGIDRKQLSSLEGMLADLGVTMSDVFGANAILWVEGMTEQLCFPKILSSVAGSNPSHIKPIALKDVGRADKAKASADVLWDA
jgi:energy-coupling factor transporter ATP-binding protein EcfA2